MSAHGVNYLGSTAGVIGVCAGCHKCIWCVCGAISAVSGVSRSIGKAPVPWYTNLPSSQRNPNRLWAVLSIDLAKESLDIRKRE